MLLVSAVLHSVSDNSLDFEELSVSVSGAGVSAQQLFLARKNSHIVNFFQMLFVS